MKLQSVPRSKQTACVSVIQTGQLMLCREIMAVCCEIHTKHTNTLCGQNVQCPDVKLPVATLAVSPQPIYGSHARVN